MTKEQKAFILSSHEAGKTYAEIAAVLEMSPHTVKSVCMRNKSSIKPDQEKPPAIEKKEECRMCGAPLKQTPHHRAKLFCSDSCRLSWWHAHRNQARNANLHICPACGAAFTADASRKYCCHSCYIKARYA